MNVGKRVAGQWERAITIEFLKRVSAYQVPSHFQPLSASPRLTQITDEVEVARAAPVAKSNIVIFAVCVIIERDGND